ncbi:MAG: hypothetical protein AAGI30_13950 [Planctomycetota bacterium]
MADEQAEQQQSQQDAEAPAKKGGLPVKTLILVAGILLAEAGLIVGVMMFIGNPSQVQGLDVEGEIDPGDELLELPVLHEKFTNTSTGRVWIWDTEVMVVVQKRHEERVKERLEQHNATTRTGIGEIIAAANHQFFNEPGRPTITRQMTEYMQRLIGRDEATGEEIVQRALIPSCTGFPTDY